MSRKDRDNKNITLKLSIFSVYGHGARKRRMVSVTATDSKRSVVRDAWKTLIVTYLEKYF